MRLKFISLLTVILLAGFLSAQNCVPDNNGNVTCTDYSTNAALNIDLRIANKHNATVNLPIFTTQDHANGVFVRNPDCWAYNLDLTCISPSHGAPPSYQCAGTLITPRHVLLAAHLAIKVGDSIRFVTKDNQTITRKVILDSYTTDWSQTWPDILVLLLDKDVPSTITPCQFLPPNYTKYLASDGKGLPVLKTDQEEKALVSDLSQISSTAYTQKFFFLDYPTNIIRQAMYEDIIGGDSGNPAFLVLDGQLVFLGTFTFSGGGSSLTYMANLATGGDWTCRSIPDIIQSIDSRAGVNTGHKIKFFNFENTTDLTKATKNTTNIYVHNNILKIELTDSQTSNIEVFDVSGRQLIKQNTAKNDFSFTLPSKGIYFVYEINSISRKTYKVLAN